MNENKNNNYEYNCDCGFEPMENRKPNRGKHPILTALAPLTLAVAILFSSAALLKTTYAKPTSPEAREFVQNVISTIVERVRGGEAEKNTAETTDSADATMEEEPATTVETPETEATPEKTNTENLDMSAGETVENTGAETEVSNTPVPVVASIDTTEYQEPIPVTPVLTEDAWKQSRCRDDIVCNGTLLPYDVQETMQDISEEYGIPYPLMLAMAEAESGFDVNALSSGGDTGLMQINPCVHQYLADMGIDVHTVEGNIEASAFFMRQYLDECPTIDMALMEYNCGPGNARAMWGQGIFSTTYSDLILSNYEKWYDILES